MVSLYGELSAASGSCLVVVIPNAAGAIMRVRDLLLAVRPAESVTVTVSGKVPGTVSVPFSATLIGSKVNPGMLGVSDRV